MGKVKRKKSNYPQARERIAELERIIRFLEQDKRSLQNNIANLEKCLEQSANEKLDLMNKLFVWEGMRTQFKRWLGVSNG